MRTILWYVPPEGGYEEQDVTIDEINEAGFTGLMEYWNERAGENYPRNTLNRFYREVYDQVEAVRGEPSGPDSYMKLVRIAQDLTVSYFPRRTGYYQYSLVLMGPTRNEAAAIVCRDYPPQEDV